MITEEKETINGIKCNHEGYVNVQCLASNLLYSAFTSNSIEDFLNKDFDNFLVKTEYNRIV